MLFFNILKYVCYGGGLFFFIFGLIGLIRGKITLSKQRDYTGRQARLVGIGLMIFGILLAVCWLVLS